MTDRELLELAAKAAGFQNLLQRQSPRWSNGHYWNPLTDDGDALRLAATLGISVSYDRLDQGVEERRVFAVWGRGVELEHLGADRYAATRRAIVKAAAEIGRKA